VETAVYKCTFYAMVSECLGTHKQHLRGNWKICYFKFKKKCTTIFPFSALYVSEWHFFMSNIWLRKPIVQPRRYETKIHHPKRSYNFKIRDLFVITNFRSLLCSLFCQSYTCRYKGVISQSIHFETCSLDFCYSRMASKGIMCLYFSVHTSLNILCT
jgi:hypothetical protein